MLSRREQSGEIMCLDTFVFVFLKLSGRDFPGGPVAKTLHS